MKGRNRLFFLISITSTFLILYMIFVYFDKKRVEMTEPTIVAQIDASQEIDQQIEHQNHNDNSINKEESLSISELEIKNEVELDVSLLNQMDYPQLYNGCEVTSLAMLLNYHNIDVTKNDLAALIPKVPYMDNQGLYGDPNEGFVGDISAESGPGFFVYFEPIYELALQLIDEELEVVDLKGATKEEFQLQLSDGNPIWVITTVTYQPTDDLVEWDTINGKISVSMNEHSVLVTGYDADEIIINDPYGYKNRKINAEHFFQSWEQMGSQALTIKKV